MKRIKMTLMLMFFFCLTFYAQSSNDAEKEAVKKTALDYGDGWYSGSAERMERALHSELNKVLVTKLNQNGKIILQYSTVSELIEMTRGKAGFVEESKRNENVSVFTIDGNVACAKLNSAIFNDYLQMVKIDGKWKIINVLWNWGPESQRKPVVKDFNFDAEKEEIKKASIEFAEGMIGADLSKFEKTAHPEINLIQMSTLPATGRQFINRMGYGLITELIRLKMTIVPENMRTVEVNILDAMDGYAFVKNSTPAMEQYLQLAKTGGPVAGDKRFV